MNDKSLLLLILLNVCHWLADYTHLSTNWMLSAKKLGKPILPIFSHALVHAGLMFFVLVWFTGITPMLFLLQLITHFCVDVLKGRLNGWFPTLANPANKYHWYVFGVDQFLHQLVIIFMVYLALY